VSDLTTLMSMIVADDHTAVLHALDADPSLVTAGLARADEFFRAERFAQVYQGATALHAAAFSYDVDMAGELVRRGADVWARDRRGAEPLHSAMIGGPTAPTWDPPRQTAMIAYLVEAGADPNGRAAGGVTPLHRAVRNRCSAAVGALLELGADPGLANDSGSTAADLVHWTTGRGGTGTPEAKAQQRLIAQLLGVE
jgi:ankyrin repeat protein